MATYVNDLRLKEIATGDESGTWGTSTNTNLELIAEAFSFGTEAITTNADTHTTTIADGSTDPGRSIYLKYTGTLDSACTITIGPNTVSKLWFIENGTSGSQNIIISQGSGANVTIPAGDVKVVYSDGAGSGAAIVDAFASLNVVDLKVEDDLTVTDDLIVNGDIDLAGSIDVDGTANLDVVDIDGALTQDGGAVFNEDSADVDFRVESNGQTHALFVDGGLDNVGIGYSSKPTATVQGLNILTGGGNGGIQLNREVGGNPSDGETLGSYAWKGVDGANTNAAAEASIVAIAAEDHSGSTAATSMAFNTKPTGTGPGSAPTERMRIDSSGNVGIGSTTINAKFNVHGTIRAENDRFLAGRENAAAPAYSFHDDGDTGMFNVASNILGFSTSGTERMRITDTDVTVDAAGDIILDADGGNILFKDGSVGTFLDIQQDSSGPELISRVSDADFKIRGNDGGSTVTALSFDMSEGGLCAIGSHTPTAKLDVRGSQNSEHVVITGGSNSGRGLSIQTAVSGSQNDAGVIFDAQDTESGANPYHAFQNAGSESMRITSDGKIGVGTSSPQELLHVSTGSTVAIRASGGGNSARKVEIGYDNTNGPYLKSGSSGVISIQFYVDNTTLAGKFDTNADFYTNDGTVHSLSDSRVKTDINDLIDGLDVVKQLKPKTFKYNEKSEFYSEKTKDEVRYGFIADEVQEVAPQYMQVGKGKIDGVEVDDFKTLSTTKMIPMLVKAIQEQQTQIDALQSEINILKGE
jgi:hypothetical protein